MRTSTFLAGAALVAGAFASPLKRDLEIDTVYDVTYETVTLTETDGATAAAVAATTSTVAAVSTSSAVSFTRHGHRHSKASSVASSSSVVEKVAASAAPASTSSAAALEGWTSTWASTWVITPSANTEVASSTPSTTSTTAVASSSAAAYSAASSSEASKTSTASSSKATTYQERVLAHHNVHRANHSADALVWDSDLASTASTIAATCVYAHSMDVNGGGYGQNIAAGVESNNISAVITELFYNGEVNYFNGLYGQADPDMTNFENWGHFSQLVWKGTTKVGCATQYCSGGLQNVGSNVSPYFTVCNYGSPGNYASEYADNIGKSLGHATQGWSYDL